MNLGSRITSLTWRARAAAALAMCLALAAALLLLSAPLARAASIGFDAQPLPGSPNAALGFFKFDAAAGASVPRVLVITNRSAKTKVIHVAPCDGMSAVFGGVAYSASDAKPTAVGSWIGLSSTKVTVPAGSSVQLPFTVSVPAAVTSGIHLGGIALWEPAAATTNNSGGNASAKATTKITMVTRTVISMLVTTPGPAVPDLTITGVKAEARPDGMYMLVTLTSNGTAPASGQGTISVPNENFQQPIALGDMVPQSSTAYPVLWKTNPAAGTYQAKVSIPYADGTKLATWSGDFTVASAALKDLQNRLVPTTATASAQPPWLTYGLIGGLVLIVLIMGFALLRRRRPDPTT